MANINNFRTIRSLNKRGDSNSSVTLIQELSTEKLYVRKVIYGIETPLYGAIFNKEITALYKLNKCDNIVRIIYQNQMIEKSTNEKVGVIFLEHIDGQNLDLQLITRINPKEKFVLIKQLINAIEMAHSFGIIHRDICPNNIMVTDDLQLKIIDFGICKIKDMITNATTYKMGTNAYSAPEVHLHSENATEKSDLYSIGAVIYYLFTGSTPPLAINFQEEIDKTSGIDYELKQIIKKLVQADPKDRYIDIFELKKEFSKLFIRFLDIDRTVIITADIEKIGKLKKNHLIPYNTSKQSAEEKYIPENFLETYAYVETLSEEPSFIFLGTNYKMICTYNEIANCFEVIDFIKILPIDREYLKKKYMEMNYKIRLVDYKYVHREIKNNSLECKNIILDYQYDILSKSNVHNEFKNKYGVWKELLSLVKENIENNIEYLSYTSYNIKDDIITFTLDEGVFVKEDRLNKEQVFVYEQPSKTTNKKKIYEIGYYDNDIFENQKVKLSIKRSNNHHLQLKQQGMICVDYRKDLVNVEKQIDAIDTLEREEFACSFNLKSIFAGIEAPLTKEITSPIKFFDEKLDLTQRISVEKALNSESIAIIQGPPGTGKTNVIVEIIQQIIKQNMQNSSLKKNKILLVSQSHTAVDKMLDDLSKLNRENIDLVRIGRDEKLGEGIKEKYGLDCVRTNWTKDVIAKSIKFTDCLYLETGFMQSDFNQYYDSLQKSKIDNAIEKIDGNKKVKEFCAKFNSPKEEQTRKIMEIQRQWIDEITQCNESELYLLKSTTIIAGTCTGFISNKVIRDVDFDYVIIDEAAKATFPELSISLNKAQKIILVGDHKQLPPILDNDIIKEHSDMLDEKNLKEGIFEKLYNIFPETNRQRLLTQYRMHPAIGNLISQIFYDNDIQNGVGAQERQISISGYEDIAIEWVDTSRHTVHEKSENPVGKGTNKSYRNFLERNIIKGKLIELDRKLPKHSNIAVITAYSAQRYLVANMVKQLVLKNITVDVDTVDAFQGSQKDIIIYSTVRSSSAHHDIGFLRSEARLNVAFSRARKLLIIIGDARFLNNTRIRQNKFPDVLKYIEQNNYCRLVEHKMELRS